MTNIARKIAIIQGHPDPSGAKFGHALAAAYADGAKAAGHEVQTIDVAQIDFPLLRTKEDFEHNPPPPSLAGAAAAIRWSDHVAIFFPLWLGTMPALLKGFFEQVFRPQSKHDDMSVSLKNVLKGKTGRIVVTMGMPAIIYRWYFHAHGVRGLEKNVLKFCGMGAVKESLIGMVEAQKPQQREKWLNTMRSLGHKAL